MKATAIIKTNGQGFVTFGPFRIPIEDFKKVAPTLRNKPILLDGEVVGKVLDVEWKNGQAEVGVIFYDESNVASVDLFRE